MGLCVRNDDSLCSESLCEFVQFGYGGRNLKVFVEDDTFGDNGGGNCFAVCTVVCALHPAALSHLVYSIWVIF